MSAAWIAVLVVVLVAAFVWGWARASSFRAEHARSPWGIPPIGWGVIHVVLLPVAWILYFGARRSTRVADSSLASVPDAIYADTPEQRAELAAYAARLPSLPAPVPSRHGWHADPLGQAAYRFFDGQRWAREVTDEPSVAPVAGPSPDH